MDEQKTEGKKSEEKKRWQKLLSLLIEKVIEKAWYIVLLTISTVYLVSNRFAIEKLDDASLIKSLRESQKPQKAEIKQTEKEIAKLEAYVTLRSALITWNKR